MKKKVARATAVAERPRFDELEVARMFGALCERLSDAGELEAVDVLYRLDHALRHGDERLPGQKLTSRAVLAKMAALASDAPSGVRGPRSTRQSRAEATLIRYVEASRANGLADAVLAISLAWSWVHTYGAPAELAHVLVHDEARLAALVHEDARKFVRNVQRALFPGVRADNNSNAEHQRRSRAHRAKRRRA